jgi:iron complex transport system substrate-binding protein
MFRARHRVGGQAPAVAQGVGWRRLSPLDAVKNKRFVIIELESLLPGNRLAYTVKKLAKTGMR